MFGMFFLGALYLQKVLGYEPLQTGVAFLPVTIVMGTLSVRYSERITMQFGARNALVAGLVFIAAALALLARIPVGGDYVTDVLPTMVLLGLGGGIAFPALMTLAMSGVRPEEAGLASGLVNTTGPVGCALGLAVLAALSTARTTTLTEHGDSIKAALTGGYHLAFWVAAAVVVVAVVIARTVLRPADQPTPDGVAEESLDGQPILERV
jgi:MFS family permease